MNLLQLFCNLEYYHEGLKFCISVAELRESLDDHLEENVGNFDCSMIGYFDEIFTEFPTAKFFLIERSPSEVVDSLLDFQLMDDYIKTEKWIDNINNQIRLIKAQHNMR